MHNFNIKNFSFNFLEEINNITKVYKVEIKHEEFSIWAKEANKNKTINGFRKGHAPESMFKDDFINDCVGFAMQELVKEFKLKDIFQSFYSIENFEEEMDISMKITIELLPSLPKINFEEIEFESLEPEVSIQEVEESIENYSKKQEKPVDLEEKRPSQTGDFINMQVIFESTQESKDFSIKLGRRELLEEVESEILNKNENDEFSVKLKDHPETLNIKILKIQGSKPLEEKEIMQEFNKESSQDLRSFFKEKLEDSAKEQSNIILKEEIKKYIIDKEFQTPVSLEQKHLKRAYNVFLNEINFQEGTDLEEEIKKHFNTSKEEFDKEMQEKASKKAKIQFFLEHFAYENKLTITKENISSLIKDQQRFFPKGLKEAEAFFEKNKEAKEVLISEGLQQNAINFISNKIIKKIKKASLKEIFEREVN